MLHKFRPLLNRRNLFILLALIFIGYAAFASLGVIGRNYKLQQEVDRLTREVDLLRLQNQELEYRIIYYRTDAFIEKEARDKLGRQAPGEHVVIFPDKIPVRSTVATNAANKPEESIVQQSLTNFEQWLYFLFRIEPKDSSI